jgi:ABC-type transport system involved in cytochrome bd biosynthesis fused ATPase/permease subunit
MRASHDPVSADTLVADPQAPPVVIETRGLQKTYFGKVAVPVLHGIDLRIRAGEFVAIIGQSGSGKSTLLNILGALDVPTGGTVLINGVDIGALDDDAFYAAQALASSSNFTTCSTNTPAWRMPSCRSSSARVASGRRNAVASSACSSVLGWDTVCKIIRTA